jgi:threonine synthase
MTSAGAPRRGAGLITRYGEFLPVGPETPIVSLGEGSTPLVRSERFSEECGAEVWLKYEGLNPTGSFKDRGMTLAISKALEEGSSAVVCASTGNTSASAAAYAARAGMTCAVLIPGGHVARGKLAQASMHGATVLEIEENFDRALELVTEVARDHPITVVNSVNPFRIEGQKTAAFEIVEALDDAPDLHLMPVGNAGNITAYWRGYREARDVGWSSSLPRMFGFQASGAAPIVRGETIERPETVATAIRIGNPASWRGALEAAGDSSGAIAAISDDEIITAHRDLAEEGLFVELASAAGVAGLRRMASVGSVPEGATVVCVLTGHGLKDPEWAIESSPAATAVEADAKSLLAAMNLV